MVLKPTRLPGAQLRLSEGVATLHPACGFRLRMVVQDGEEAQVPESLLEVEAVAHDEFRADPEALVTDRDRDALPSFLREQRAHLERRRTARAQVPQQVVQRETGVDDVLDDN